jgi:MFS family permease
MSEAGLVDSRIAWIRLAAIVALSTLGGVGMWSVVVALPHVQAEFGATRAEASLPYTLTMLGFAGGGILMGRLADRFGIMLPVMGGAVMLGLGYAAAALAPSLMVYAVAQGVLIGALGSAAAFGPLMADASLWFRRRRGIAVALAASGNYLAGVVWPPLLNALVLDHGWRVAHAVLGAICVATMIPLALMLRRRAPGWGSGAPAAREAGMDRPLGFTPNGLTLCSASRVSAAAWRWRCRRSTSSPIAATSATAWRGGRRCSPSCSAWHRLAHRLGLHRGPDRRAAHAAAGVGAAGLRAGLYLFFDGLTSLYIVSALFGLFQGGIVPSYAVIVREHFRTGEVGTRVGIVLMSTLVGMALGGWLSGLIFDLAGGYHAAFLNGLAWNALNVAIVATLLIRAQGGTAARLRGAAG